VKYSVIGGTASVIGGGKFANGAMTGAFQYLFNEVFAKYNSRTGRLSVRDVQTGKEVSGNFFSGSKFGDGAAKGDYYILEGTYKDGQPRFRLEAVDSVWGDDENNNSGQTLLRLHGPGQSIGCITACDASGWNAVYPLILNTATSVVQVNSYYGPSFYGRQPFGKFQTGVESVRYYGILHVE